MEDTGLSPFKERHDPSILIPIDKDGIYPKPSWMLNESVLDTTWIVGKTGHPSKATYKRTAKISFDQEISSNELLTDRSNLALLEDIRNSLLYLSAKGKMTRPRRSFDVLLTACHLVFHANEMQDQINKPHIKILSEISFEHVKDYLLAFKVERHDFDKCLEIILDRYKSKGEIDWDSLKQSTGLVTRKFISLKDKLIKYLESHEKGFEREFSYNKKYPNACNTNFDIDRDLAPRIKTISNEISKIHTLHTSRPAQKYKFRHNVRDLFSSGSTIFSELVESEKTPLMPVNIALHTLSSALHFARNYGPPLRKYLSLLHKAERKIIASVTAKEHTKSFAEFQREAFENTPIPDALKDLNITSWRQESDTNELYTEDFGNNISIGTAIRIYIASIWILISSFTTGRATSINTLRRDCFVQSPIDGLYDLILRIPKSSERWELEEVQRPIPDLIYDYGLEFAAFVSEMEDRRNLVHSDNAAYLFSSNLNPRSLTANTYAHLSWETTEHLKALSDDTVIKCLDMFFDWIDSPLTNGKRWYGRTHQFRRFFAVLYFNITDGEGLDELSWFMGHSNLDQTFHYAEVAPTDEWIEEAELAISRVGASLNKHINADDDIRGIVDKSRQASNISTVIEPLVKKLISEHKKKSNQEVRFCKIEGEDVFFYFSEKKGG
tara:strand:- start:2900 stop:4900 length:2001 start_codon:yes stop_codon:yes gene_type:complete